MNVHVTFVAALAVTTSGISKITSAGATSGGNVSEVGDNNITERGICWSTSINPKIDGNHTSDGTTLGEFKSVITSLTPSTTYHVRAYANSIHGTNYGNEKTFTTSTISPTVISYVSSDGNCGTKKPCYSKIQEAINNATTGSTILVKQGIYAESISLGSGKTLLIKGGYNEAYSQQTANTTFIQTSGPTSIKASSGSLKLQMIGVK